jgi:hypothetical protein
VNQPPASPKNRHSFRPLLVAPPASGTVPVAAPARPSRSPNDSHVRLRSPAAPLPRATDIEFLDAQELLDELCEDQLTMSMSLTCLEEAVGQAPRDASARAALRTLESRLADLGALRDALARVMQTTVDPRVQRLVVPDAPLADYLRGIHSWTNAVMRALDQLAASLRTLQPDWALLRWRIEEAKNFHFDELFPAIRADLQALVIVANGGSFGANMPQIHALQDAVEQLFAAATTLEANLDQRFG